MDERENVMGIPIIGGGFEDNLPRRGAHHLNAKHREGREKGYGRGPGAGKVKGWETAAGEKKGVEKKVKNIRSGKGHKREDSNP